MVCLEIMLQLITISPQHAGEKYLTSLSYVTTSLIAFLHKKQSENHKQTRFFYDHDGKEAQMKCMKEDGPVFKVTW